MFSCLVVVCLVTVSDVLNCFISIGVVKKQCGLYKYFLDCKYFAKDLNA